MCFAPQRRALFQHLNFQKCSGPVSFLHFWLRYVLRAKRACTFSTCQQIIRKKHSVSRLFYLFGAPASSFSDSFSSLIFSLLLFSSLALLTSAFPTVHIVGSLTSKFPSNIWGGLNFSRFPIKPWIGFLGCRNIRKKHRDTKVKGDIMGTWSNKTEIHVQVITGDVRETNDFFCKTQVRDFETRVIRSMFFLVLFCHSLDHQRHVSVCLDVYFKNLKHFWFLFWIQTVQSRSQMGSK